MRDHSEEKIPDNDVEESVEKSDCTMVWNKLRLGECEVAVRRPKILTQDEYDELDDLFRLILKSAVSAILKTEN